MIHIVGIVCIFCLVLVTVVFISMVIKRDRIARRVRTQVDALTERTIEFENRKKIIESHALDYMNSIGADGGKALNEIGETISWLHGLIEEVHTLISTRDLAALEEARRMLEEPTESGFTLATEWERQLEDLLQEVGREISRASQQARESGLPKRKRKQSTMTSLTAAKIITGGPYEW